MKRKGRGMSKMREYEEEENPTVEEHPSAETRSRSRPRPWNLTLPHNTKGEHPHFHTQRTLSLSLLFFALSHLLSSSSIIPTPHTTLIHPNPTIVNCKPYFIPPHPLAPFNLYIYPTAAEFAFFVSTFSASSSSPPIPLQTNPPFFFM